MSTQVSSTSATDTPAPANCRVLIVEDEPDLRAAMVDYLNIAGFTAEGVGDLKQMMAWQRSNTCDVVVLDAGLPDGDGFSFAEHLRSSGCKVIMATARGTVDDRILGYSAGIEGYLVKPVDLRELVTLIKNVIYRDRPVAPRAVWMLDTMRWELCSPWRSRMHLTRSELIVLSALAEQPGRAVSRDQLARLLGHDPAIYDFRRLEILLRRLRNKGRAEFDQAVPIETVHGFGYVFTDVMKVC